MPIGFISRPFNHMDRRVVYISIPGLIVMHIK
nr:MAG TPA: hypothetical protein [Bacteriophage sp.]